MMMKKMLKGAVVATALWASCLSPALGMDETALTAGRFGKVHLYRQSPRPSRVVLFISGDGGWNQGVVDMARILTGRDALVVGIDIVAYLKQLGQSGGPCLYPAADFEALSKFVQKTLNYREYVQPVLAGYSSGATLVYALLCQAPANTFKGGLSMGFCADQPLARAPCKGSGLAWKPGPKKGVYIFSPSGTLQTPWIAFQGDIDQVCDPRSTEAFVARVRGAELIKLPKVGHGFSVARNWQPQFLQAFARLAAPSPATAGAGLDDLPLVEVPANGTVRSQLAVMISGDGGWAGIDRDLAGELANHGLAVVGLNSLKYFWSPRTPDGAAHDLERILVHYLQAWQKEGVALIGYSLGADVLPFLAARLPAEMRSRIQLVALLGPSRETAFEFHLSDWMGGSSRAGQYPVAPEVKKLDTLRTLCFFGDRETDSLCRDPLPAGVIKIPLSGGHHFGNTYTAIAAAILRALEPH